MTTPQDAVIEPLHCSTKDQETHTFRIPTKASGNRLFRLNSDRFGVTVIRLIGFLNDSG